MGAKLVKYSTDIRHSRPFTHACMSPEAMEQMSRVVMEFQKNIPTIEKYGLKIAIENHCDLFADEVVWMVKKTQPSPDRSLLRHDQLSHPRRRHC